MKTKARSKKELLDEIKSCFQEMGLPLTENVTKLGPFLKTCAICGSFSVYIQVLYEVEYESLKLTLTFFEIVDETKRFDFQRAINCMNYHLMDIGHFWVTSETSNIYFNADIVSYGEVSQKRHIIENLKRLVILGIRSFELLLRMVDSDPETFMHEFIQEIVEEENNEVPGLQ